MDAAVTSGTDAFAPRSSTPAFVPARPASSTSTSASAHPRPASSRAVQRPIPLPAPVTMATPPSRRKLGAFMFPHPDRRISSWPTQITPIGI